METFDNRRLTEENVGEINCCPGGLEVTGKAFKGDLRRALTWRQEMLELGMRGFVSYQDGVARGFIEYMPAEVAPFPIEAPGGAVLMCYHWEPLTKGDEKEHHAQEKRLINRVIMEAAGRFSGLATLGWDDPVHFPITMLEELGFQQLERSDYIALMWRPLEEGAPRPRMAPTQFQPRDLSSQGLLAIDSAWSSRCPYSIHNAARLEEVLAGLPGEHRARIRHFPHRIDTHDGALQWSIRPWNWEWVFANGEEVVLHKLKTGELQGLLAEKVAMLPGVSRGSSRGSDLQF